MKKIDELKWKLYCEKAAALTVYGSKKGLIHTYEEELIENLRHVYCGALPASILLLCEKMCNGFCYDRALLITLGFGDDDFRLVYADVDSLRLKPYYISKNKDQNNPNYANHCFAERTKKDGSVWVYDTSSGLVAEKSLYYKIDNPQITKVFDKNEVLGFHEYQEIKNADIETDKYALPLILPSIEAIAEAYPHFYTDRLKAEIEHFKQEIDYDSIAEEIDKDMREKGLKR